MPMLLGALGMSGSAAQRGSVKVGGPVSCGVGCGRHGEAGFEEKKAISFVGTGGNWEAEATYKFVGDGQGQFEMVTVQTNHRSRSWYFWLTVSVVSVFLVILGVLLWVFRHHTAESATAFAPQPAIMNTSSVSSKSCTIFGDPHIMTFDGMHSDYYTPGEYWIVRSSNVKIQGRYLATSVTNGLAVTKEIAVGGPFLSGHTLIIGAMVTLWDNQPILTTFPSHFEVPGLVNIQYNPFGQVMQADRAGKGFHVVHAQLPSGVQLEINRWNEPREDHYINVKITMTPQPDQDGHCGNFNGNLADDDRLQVRARVGRYGVAAEELMLMGGKTPIVPTTDRPDVNDCHPTILRQARAACKNREGVFFPSMECLIDYCFSGKQFAAQDFA
jgi:hypothetical protein